MSHMPVVSNTSPILNLAIIGELSLLREQFGKILIPKAVLEELHVEEELPGSKALRVAIEGGWIKIEEAKEMGIIRAMQRDLDTGESEAIALAVQVNADWILMDERDGRKAARAMQLKTIGALGILVKARREGTLKSLRHAMDRLREKAGFYIQAELYNALLQEAGEKR
jgi:uncharacterized protein